MKRGLLIAMLGVALAACEKREAPPAASTAADSAAADSVAPDSTARPDTTGQKSADPKIIGHDSAFGPIGAINDSTGKLEELPVRRP